MNNNYYCNLDSIFQLQLLQQPSVALLSYGTESRDNVCPKMWKHIVTSEVSVCGESHET